jgi:hypothetical protein
VPARAAAATLSSRAPTAGPAVRGARWGARRGKNTADTPTRCTCMCACVGGPLQAGRCQTNRLWQSGHRQGMASRVGPRSMV